MVTVISCKPSCLEVLGNYLIFFFYERQVKINYAAIIYMWLFLFGDSYCGNSTAHHRLLAKKFLLVTIAQIYILS